MTLQRVEYIDIGGETRPMELDGNCMCEFEKLVNRKIQSVFRIGEEDSDGKPLKPDLGFLEVRALVYVGLRNRNPKIKLGDVGKWLTFATLGSALTSVIRAVIRYNGKDPDAVEEEPKTEDPTPAKATPSGPSSDTSPTVSESVRASGSSPSVNLVTSSEPTTNGKKTA